MVFRWRNTKKRSLHFRKSKSLKRKPPKGKDHRPERGEKLTEMIILERIFKNFKLPPRQPGRKGGEEKKKNYYYTEGKINSFEFGRLAFQVLCLIRLKMNLPPLYSRWNNYTGRKQPLLKANEDS